MQLKSYLTTLSFFYQPPVISGLIGAQVEEETVNEMRDVTMFTCTDTIDDPTASITVSPSTNPEFFKLQTVSINPTISGKRLRTIGLPICVIAVNQVFVENPWLL